MSSPDYPGRAEKESYSGGRKKETGILFERGGKKEGKTPARRPGGRKGFILISRDSFPLEKSDC